MQYDSWWYPKGLRSGTETWWPMKKIFPGGFKYVYNKTDLPFGCHNRYWDSDVTYAKFNGGKFQFIKDPLSGLTLPDDDTFWLFLFQQTQEWGNFFLYEQDWLNIQTEATFALQSDLDLGRRWLEQMGRNAEKFGISIQYCMAYSRHILQSLEIPAVTQARASEDYQPGKRQWDIGITSMFIHAVGLAPSKDTFWTTAVQPGNRYHAVENNTVLNHLVATLSTGPVGPGDMIGALNKSLIMRCCDSEGRILQPSKPATAIDDQIIKGTFPSYPGPQGQVWTSYSKISNNVFGIVLATEMENQYSLTPEAGWSGQLAPSVVYGQEPWASHRPVEFSSQHPLVLGADCSAERPCVFYTSPTILVLPNLTGTTVKANTITRRFFIQTIGSA
ncbi:uncharacterized protein LOC106013638 [Aplysia californica]|uniref:Uncharacterized protein LOC106013638 n=1 Tax=Aplysia californica TaxID=6500 RepID=A0ABM1AD04_APLCA|nr:uncharacterized protein LOC106013638 [Aplysia californica]